jgi:transcriptional regulator with XRE-family HTH domain
MLPLVWSAASLVVDARTAANLSRKRLAKRAGVPTSTVTRVEEGATDPSIGMLDRLLAAAGRSLALEAGPPPAASVARLTDAWHARPEGDQPDWTRFRSLVDHLRLHPDVVAAAIEIAPMTSGSDRIDNLLAGVAEKLADDHHLERPPWTRAVLPLTEPWESSGTPRMRAKEGAEAPRQLRARNILLAEDNIWRRRG